MFLRTLRLGVFAALGIIQAKQPFGLRGFLHDESIQCVLEGERIALLMPGFKIALALQPLEVTRA